MKDITLQADPRQIALVPPSMFVAILINAPPLEKERLLRGLNHTRPLITMPCGCKLEPKVVLPAHDVPCPCGDKSHWLLKFEDIMVAPIPVALLHILP